LFNRVLGYAHKGLFPSDPGGASREENNRAFNIREQSSAYGRIGCGSHMLCSLLGRLQKAELGK